MSVHVNTSINGTSSSPRLIENLALAFTPQKIRENQRTKGKAKKTPPSRWRLRKTRKCLENISHTRNHSPLHLHTYCPDFSCIATAFSSTPQRTIRTVDSPARSSLQHHPNVPMKGDRQSTSFAHTPPVTTTKRKKHPRYPPPNPQPEQASDVVLVFIPIPYASRKESKS